MFRKPILKCLGNPKKNIMKPILKTSQNLYSKIIFTL